MTLTEMDPGTRSPDQASAVGGVAAITASLNDLEQLSGFVSDMMMAGMSRNPADLDQIIKDRLGPNATMEDARRIIAAFEDIDAA